MCRRRHSQGVVTPARQQAYAYLRDSRSRASFYTSTVFPTVSVCVWGGRGGAAVAAAHEVHPAICSGIQVIGQVEGKEQQQQWPNAFLMGILGAHA